jgi:hypothetical protein
MVRNNVYKPFRYLERAKKILAEKAKLDKDGQRYLKTKYVKIAGNCAYLGVIIALQDWIKYQLHEELPKKRFGSLDIPIEYFKEKLAKHNQIMLAKLNDVYLGLRFYMGEDGYSRISLIKDSFKIAKEIIEWVFNTIKEKRLIN